MRPGATLRAVRFLRYGPDNRPGSTAHGWYLDDIQVTGPNWVAIGRTSGTSFTISGRPGGSNTYRVGALYAETMLGPWSNETTTKVKAASGGGSPKAVGGEPKPDRLPATGVGVDPTGFALLAGAVLAGLAARRRRA